MPFDHFDFLAPFYDRAIRGGLTQDLLELLAPRAESLILDAAGGTGRLALPLRDHSAQVVVADLSFPMLAQARQKNRLLTTQASTLYLPFTSGSFDRVMIVDALHHLREQAPSVRELYRVLKPGGRLLIEEPDIASFPVKLIALGEWLAGMGSHFLGGAEISNLFTDHAGSTGLRRKNHTLWVWIDKPA